MATNLAFQVFFPSIHRPATDDDLDRLFGIAHLEADAALTSIVIKISI